jgi:hypothetical protein
VSDLGRIVTLHARWEAAHPTEAESQRDYEGSRQARYETAHGSLDGYEPRRQFPCPGALRAFDETPVMILAECEQCGYQIAFRRERRPAAAASPEPAPF